MLTALAMASCRTVVFKPASAGTRAEWVSHPFRLHCWGTSERWARCDGEEKRKPRCCVAQFVSWA